LLPIKTLVLSGHWTKGRLPLNADELCMAFAQDDASRGGSGHYVLLAMDD